MDHVLPALSTVLTAAPDKNQFSLLLSDKGFVWDFPTETVDFLDDSGCWVECRLYHADTNELLVITGWSLEWNDNDGWRLDNLEW